MSTRKDKLLQGMFNLFFEKVPTVGDGNCLFNAAYLQDGTKGSSATLRALCIKVLNDNKAYFSPFINAPESILQEHRDQLNSLKKIPEIQPLFIHEHLSNMGLKEIGNNLVISNLDFYFLQYLLQMGTQGTYAGEPEVLALSLVLQRPIYVFNQNSLSDPLIYNNNIDGTTLPGEPILLHYSKSNKHYSALNLRVGKELLQAINEMKKPQAAEQRLRRQLTPSTSGVSIEVPVSTPAADLVPAAPPYRSNQQSSSAIPALPTLSVKRPLTSGVMGPRLQTAPGDQVLPSIKSQQQQLPPTSHGRPSGSKR